MGASASVEIVSLSAEALAKARVCVATCQLCLRHEATLGLIPQLTWTRVLQNSHAQVADEEDMPSVVAETIRDNEIDGSTLNELTPEDMDALAENQLDRKKLRGALNRRYY